MTRCRAITATGSRCTGSVSPGVEWCYNHDRSRADERRRNASRGGKTRRTSEMASVKAEIKRVIEDVLESRIERGVGTAAFMGFNALLKAIETERKIRESEELEERIAALEQAEGVRGWGA